MHFSKNVKSVRIRRYSGSYFPALGLNTERQDSTEITKFSTSQTNFADL